MIERETGIRLSLQAVSVDLKRWGFTAQRPMKRAIERRAGEITQWLETDYPALAKRAKAEATTPPQGSGGALLTHKVHGASLSSHPPEAF